MRKQQLIQLGQFILAWVFVGLFVVFVMEQSFLEFVLNHRVYILIVSFSYFYYYSILYDTDKKYEFIRNILIYGNIYLFLHIFFRPQLNISYQLFILLGLIILGLWWTTKLTSKWRYLLQVLGGIFSFFILVSGLFYFYPDEPDIQGFLESKKVELSALGVNDIVEKKDAYIQIVNEKGSRDFLIRPNFSKVLDENLSVLYPSLKAQRDERIIIKTQYGDMLWLFPQSEIMLNFEGKDLNLISKLNGKIGFMSGVFESNLKISGDINILDDSEKEWLKEIEKNYKYEVVSYLKEQISVSNIGWANNTMMYDIDGKIVKILSKMFPSTFSKNLDNYNEFQKYFSWVDGGVNVGRYYNVELTGQSINSTRGGLKSNMIIGTKNTYSLFKH